MYRRVVIVLVVLLWSYAASRRRAIRCKLRPNSGEGFTLLSLTFFKCREIYPKFLQSTNKFRQIIYKYNLESF